MKIIRTIAIGALLAIGLTGCMYATETDQAGVHVNGYALIPTDRSVEDCKNPGTSGRAGLGDTVYKYPSGQRSFKFMGKDITEAKKLGADMPSITVVKDNIALSLTGTVTFYLNTGDCKTLEAFHKNIGVKKWGPDEVPAWVAKNTDGKEDFRGWNAMLDIYIGQPLQQALTDALLEKKVDTDGKPVEISYLDLYNGQGRDQLAKEVQANLPAAVKELSGGSYFQNFNVVLQKPDIPDNLKDALTAKVQASLQNQAQKTANETVTTELMSITDLVKVLGVQGYLTYKQNQLLQKAIDKGDISLLPVPQGSSVTIPSQQAGKQ